MADKYTASAELLAKLAGAAPESKYMTAPAPWRSMVAERLAEARRDVDHSLIAKTLLEDVGASPEDWQRINAFLKDNKLSLGETIGSGQERIVFAATPADGAADYVFKVGYDPRAFDTPDIQGVVPYSAKGVEGGVAFGVQPRAAAVYGQGWPRSKKPWEYWERRAWDLDSSLSARGWGWLDSDVSNIGLMPDGNFSVIDGELTRIHNQPFVPNDRVRTPEDAIRVLRYRGSMQR